MKETTARASHLGANLLLYASAQFVVLTILAMLVYPGGAKYDLQSDRYLFFQNFFSDLGATKTYSGRINTTSHVLFVIALGSVGLSLLIFSPAWKAIARQKKAEVAGYISQGFAVLSGLCFVGIAATPWDLVLDAHNAFVKAAFSLLLGFILSLTYVQIMNRWRKKYVIFNIAYMIVLAIYILILFFGPDLTTPQGLGFQVAAQKIIVYVSILNLALQALGIRQNTPSLVRSWSNR